MAQLAQRRGVECTRLRLRDTQLGQTVAHLKGGTLGESHRQHVGRVDGADCRAVGDTVSDRACLARSRAGEDSERPSDLGSDGSLVGI